ncbi:MAG TPA: ATP/GTP-binding protein [Acidimicrobiales bacterium]|nr:ATP/GTP-binding protein [Acidimicrobiales bacterium]
MSTPLGSPDTIAFKVVVVGPFGAGKTTLISAISEVPVVSTDVAATSAVETARKAATTVSMDFGLRTVADDDVVIKLFIYGTPGQERFSFMWDILAQGMDGYVVLVDSTDPTSWPTARLQLEYFRRLGTVPHVVGANRAEAGSPALERVAEAVGADGARVIPCDVTELESAKGLMVELLAEVLEQMIDGDGGPDGDAAFADDISGDARRADGGAPLGAGTHPAARP